MVQCLNCGHELKGAGKFCIVCGTPAGQGNGNFRAQMEGEQVRKGLTTTDSSGLEGILCLKCQSFADHYCYFCEQPFCKHHLKRLQPNRMHLDQVRFAISSGDLNEVNRNWIGQIVYACSRCYSMNYEHELDFGQREELSCFDRCNWFDPDVGSRGRRPGF